MQFVKESFIRASPERVFEFHCRRDVLEMLTPPWESVRVIQSADISKIGSQAIIETRLLGLFKTRWVAEHTRYNPPFDFEDVQRNGPFKKWCHQHIVKQKDDGATLRDQINYELPLGVLGRWLAPWLVEPRVARLFDYRHDVTREWCERGGT